MSIKRRFCRKKLRVPDLPTLFQPFCAKTVGRPTKPRAIGSTSPISNAKTVCLVKRWKR